MNIKLRNLKKISLIASAILMFSTSISFAQINTERISGENRYKTAINVSRKNFKNPKYVIIASGENYPDALMGGALSTQTKSPILLLKKNSIPEGVIDEINRLNPKEIFVLGGNGTISPLTVERLKILSGTKVKKIAGSNRFKTAAKINELRLKLNGTTKDDLDGITWHYYGAVSSNNFYDALYAAPYVGLYKNDTKWLLQLELFSGVMDFNKDFGDFGFAIGDIQERNRNGANYPSLTRGRNRYETSTMIAKCYNDPYSLNLHTNTAVITSGENYPDGLSAAGVTAIHKAPILLTPSNHLDSSVKKYLKSAKVNKVIIVGGEKSVSKAVENEIKSIK